MNRTSGNSPAATCGLCREPTLLQNSHLIPRAIYAFLREDGEKNPNPVVMKNSYTVQTSRQIRQYFLGSCYSGRGPKVSG